MQLNRNSAKAVKLIDSHLNLLNAVIVWRSCLTAVDKDLRIWVDYLKIEKLILFYCYFNNIIQCLLVNYRYLGDWIIEFKMTLFWLAQNLIFGYSRLQKYRVCCSCFLKQGIMRKDQRKYRVGRSSCHHSIWGYFLVFPFFY